MGSAKHASMISSNNTSRVKAKHTLQFPCLWYDEGEEEDHSSCDAQSRNDVIAIALGNALATYVCAVCFALFGDAFGR